MIASFRALVPPGSSARRDAPIGDVRDSAVLTLPTPGGTSPVGAGRAPLPRPTWSCTFVNGRPVWGVSFDPAPDPAREDG